MQSLIALIRERTLRADALLIPGDLANRISPEGLSQGWDFALEIGRELHTKWTIPVLGNHDVDWKKDHNPDSSYFARCLRPDFPFSKEDVCTRFFSDGFAILNLGINVQLVLINSVVDQKDETTAKAGTFGLERIDKLKQYLAKHLKGSLRLAMMHHHPVLHTGPYLDSADVIPNGDALVEALTSFGCNLVVHGHKHHPRLFISNGTVVLAAGSFSANLGKFGSAVGNMFHLLDVEVPPMNNPQPRGTVESWTFQFMKGWTMASRKFSGFPHRAGFGARGTIEDMAQKVVGLAPESDPIFEYPEAAVLGVAPELLFLTPS